jgi:Histidine kinase-like ATPase domain
VTRGQWVGTCSEESVRYSGTAATDRLDFMTVARQHLECVTSAPQRARSWLHTTLAPSLPATPASGELIHDAQLCASELLTNAIDARCATATLCTSLSADWLRLSVIDDAAGIPELRHAAPSADHGRGLMLVAAISDRWGVDPAASGKEVWVELRRPC